MEQAESKINQMQDDMDNKFNKTDDLQGQFQAEKQRMRKIKDFLKVYK